ncbi:DNA polymerase III subunit delta [Candidatus Saccharibacteria bacterium]|nr:DNA polymerase III subunit delta [Candidatus Saccharibacteria bacterium]
MFSVVAGPNYFGAKESLDTLVRDFVSEHGNMSVERIDAENSGKDQIINIVQSTPFLASKKLVVISNLSSQKDITEDLDGFLDKVAETTDLIIFEPKPDKRSSYYKNLKKIKGFQEFKELDETQLRGWIIIRVREEGAEISQSDAVYLIARVGLNQQKLSNELKKIINYDKHITRKTIDELTDPTPQSSIFNLLDVAFAGDHNKTLRLYDEQRAQGVEPLNILGMITWQMHAVAVVNSAKDLSSGEISSSSGLSPFVVQKSQNISRRLGRDRVGHILDDIIYLDTAFKTVTIDQDTAMKNFLTTLSRS